jgi:hypothetical protein
LEIRHKLAANNYSNWQMSKVIDGELFTGANLAAQCI